MVSADPGVLWAGVVQAGELAFLLARHIAPVLEVLVAVILLDDQFGCITLRAVLNELCYFALLAPLSLLRYYSSHASFSPSFLKTDIDQLPLYFTSCCCL